MLSSKLALHIHYFPRTRFKNGVELKPSNRVRMSQDGDKAVLLIKDVYEDDAGDITCELSNKKGKESSTSKLKVQSKYTCQTVKCLIIVTIKN